MPWIYNNMTYRVWVEENGEKYYIVDITYSIKNRQIEIVTGKDGYLLAPGWSGYIAGCINEGNNKMNSKPSMSFCGITIDWDIQFKLLLSQRPEKENISIKYIGNSTTADFKSVTKQTYALLDYVKKVSETLAIAHNYDVVINDNHTDNHDYQKINFDPYFYFVDKIKNQIANLEDDGYFCGYIVHEENIYHGEITITRNAAVHFSRVVSNEITIANIISGAIKIGYRYPQQARAFLK